MSLPTKKVETERRKTSHKRQRRPDATLSTHFAWVVWPDWAVFENHWWQFFYESNPNIWWLFGLLFITGQKNCWPSFLGCIWKHLGYFTSTSGHTAGVGVDFSSSSSEASNVVVVVDQCDQMVSLLIQYLAVYNNEHLFQYHKNGQSRFTILPNIKGPLKNCRRF